MIASRVAGFLIESPFTRHMYSLQQGLSVSQVERTILCPSSDYQSHLCSLVMQGLQDICTKSHPQVRSVTNSVMEMRNISNHPFLVRFQRYVALPCGALSARIQLSPRVQSILYKSCLYVSCPAQRQTSTYVDGSKDIVQISSVGRYLMGHVVFHAVSRACGRLQGLQRRPASAFCLTRHVVLHAVLLACGWLRGPAARAPHACCAACVRQARGAGQPLDQAPGCWA